MLITLWLLGVGVVVIELVVGLVLVGLEQAQVFLLQQEILIQSQLAVAVQRGPLALQMVVLGQIQSSAPLHLPVVAVAAVMAILLLEMA